MAIIPTRLTPRASARAATQRVRDAINAAKSRTGGEGRLVALTAGGLLLAFVLLAALAPILMKAPAIISSIIGFVLFALVFASTVTGAIAVWRIVKAGAMDTNSQSKSGNAIFNQATVESALSDAEDAGLRSLGPRIVTEALTGRVHGRPVAVMRVDGLTFAVIHLKDVTPATVLISPGHAPWPFALPNDGELTPLAAPGDVDAVAWTTDRMAGLTLGIKLAPALAMSAAGGEVPFVSVRGRALIMMWRKADVGTACVIAHETAKAFA